MLLSNIDHNGNKDMPIAYIFALLGTGIGVGFASGLLGVGDCFFMACP